MQVLIAAFQEFLAVAGSDIIDRYLKFFRAPADKKGDRRELSSGLDDYSDENSWDGLDDNMTGDWERLSATVVLNQLAAGEVPELAIRETAKLRLKNSRVKISLHGFTRLFPEHIFMERKVLGDEFVGALFTWLHEFAHNISGEDDFSARFADAERYLHELALVSMFKGDQLKRLQKEWESIKPVKIAKK